MTLFAMFAANPIATGIVVGAVLITAALWLIVGYGTLRSRRATAATLAEAARVRAAHARQVAADRRAAKRLIDTAA